MNDTLHDLILKILGLLVRSPRFDFVVFLKGVNDKALTNDVTFDPNLKTEIVCHKKSIDFVFISDVMKY